MRIASGQVTGHVDVINDFGISGWIADERQPVAVRVTARVDDELDHDVSCDRARPDVGSASFPSKTYGFLVRFEAPPRARIVLLVDGRPVFAAERADGDDGTMGRDVRDAVAAWRQADIPPDAPWPRIGAERPPRPRQAGWPVALAKGGRQSFRKIAVMPMEEPKTGVFSPRPVLPRLLLKGGPLWPHFNLQWQPRFCLGRVPVPVDATPALVNGPTGQAGEGFWCGPIVQHFGHMVADFGMRIATSAHADPEIPLIFSTFPGPAGIVVPFVWQMLTHLRVDHRRVFLVSQPTRFDRLDVLPQAERRYGGGPSRPHLDFMDDLVGGRGGIEPDLDRVFVSRSRMPSGIIAGETYLDDLLASVGFHVVHPESLGLAEQLRIYSRAKLLLFSEGSAIHALQLLGRIHARVLVLARRPRTHFAEASIAPRARGLTYLRAIKGLVTGLDRNGHPSPSLAATVLDERRLREALETAGIDLSDAWDDAAFIRHRDANLAAFIAYRERLGFHPRDRSAINARLRALSIRL